MSTAQLVTIFVYLERAVTLMSYDVSSGRDTVLDLQERKHFTKKCAKHPDSNFYRTNTCM